MQQPNIVQYFVVILNFLSQRISCHFNNTIDAHNIDLSNY